MQNNLNFYQLVYKCVKQIPSGKVASYGQIAKMCNAPKAARVVGYALHKNPSQGEVPCHRVVFKNGELSKGFAFGGISCQQALLEGEGITLVNNKVPPQFFVKP